MQSVKLNLGLPCYRSFHPDTVASLSGLLLRERDRIHSAIFRAHMYVDKARNSIAKLSADNADVTHLLFLDDDQIFPGDAFERLLRHDVPVVGATYFQRTPPYNHVAGHLHPGGAVAYRPLSVLEPGLQQVGSLGMGCTLITTDLLRQMRDHFGDENWFCSQEGGEDIHFFHRCKQMGVPVHLDGDFVVGHVASMVVTDAHWKAMRQDRGDPEGPDGNPPEFAPLYEEAVRRIPDMGTAVEVGSYLGRSAIVMAGLLLASMKRVHFYCVDHFRGSDDDPRHGGDAHLRHKLAVERGGGSYRKEFEDNLARAGVRSVVRDVIEGDSAESAQRFADGSVDFCYIDASHDEDSVRRDIAAWLPKIKPGGILAGHDYNWPTVKAAVDALLPGARPHSGYSWWYDVPAGTQTA